MAKGGQRRPGKRKKVIKRDNKSEENTQRRVKGEKNQDKKSKSLVRQMRGVKWDEEEYNDEIDELDEVE